MKPKKLKTILENHKLWNNDEGGERANLADSNLQYADLRDANLRSADLQHANLQYADLQHADLQYADLRDANLRSADLRGADLRGANLRGANLQHADLVGADLDYSCLPLSCGSRGMKVDARIACQIAAHFCALDCDDREFLKARKGLLMFALKSHRAKDLGLEKEKRDEN